MAGEASCRGTSGGTTARANRAARRFRPCAELDQPQNPPLGGAVSGDERRIHALVIYYLYFDFKPQDEEPEFMIRYLMRGDVTPLVVP